MTAHTGGLEAGIADDVVLLGQDGLPLAGRPCWREQGQAAPGACLDWRLSLSVGVFMGFHPAGELTFNLLTFDGIFGLPLDLRFRQWTARLEWAHVSAHLADGIRLAGERPDEDAVQPYSREWVQLQVARDLRGFVPYAGLRLVVHSTNGGSGPALQAGFTADSAAHLGLFAGADLRAAQQDGWVPTLSVLAGLRAEGEDGRVQRLGGAVYHGVEDAGRWRPDRESYLGVHFSVDGSGRMRSSTSRGR